MEQNLSFQTRSIPSSRTCPVWRASVFSTITGNNAAVIVHSSASSPFDLVSF